MDQEETADQQSQELSQAIAYIRSDTETTVIQILKFLMYQNNSLWEQSIQKLCDAIARSKKYITLDFSSSQMDEAEIEVLGTGWIQSVTQEIIGTLVEAIKTRKSSVDLHIIKDKICSQDIGELLRYITYTDTRLKLTVRNGHITNELSKALKKVIKNHESSLELDLSDNKIPLKALNTIANALQYIKFFTKINMGNTGISVSGLKALSAAIKKAPSPLHISLSKNSLKDGGAILSHAIKHTTMPLFIDLSSNEIGPNGITPIADAIASAKAPLTIVLDPNLTGESAARLEAAVLQATPPIMIKFTPDSMQAGGECSLRSIASPLLGLEKSWLLEEPQYNRIWDSISGHKRLWIEIISLPISEQPTQNSAYQALKLSASFLYTKLPLELAALICASLPSTEYYRIVRDLIIEGWNKHRDSKHTKKSDSFVELTEGNPESGHETKPSSEDEHKPDDEGGKEKADDSAGQNVDQNNLANSTSVNNITISLLASDIEEKILVSTAYKQDDKNNDNETDLHIEEIFRNLDAKANYTIDDTHSVEFFDLFQGKEMLPIGLTSVA